MQLAIIGTGYVGLTAGACFASLGFKVCCLDIDEQKVANLNSGIIHIHEAGLAELVSKGLANKLLTFSSDKKLLNNADTLIIAVGTPSSDDGSPNMTYFDAALEDIATFSTLNKSIIIKSTVPIGTAQKAINFLQDRRSDLNFNIISNPEFLREGKAVYDFLNPDRVVIGYHSNEGYNTASQLYKPFSLKDIPIVFTKNTTAELIKYSANSYLAMRIAFINEIADIAEKCGADIEEIAEGIGYDQRIGRHYLHAGPGYGGSCFPKDTKALTKFAESINQPTSIIETIINSNTTRQEKLAELIINELQEFPNKKIAVLGLTFKADTDDMRDSPSIIIINKLLDAGFNISAYDPSMTKQAHTYFANRVALCSNTSQALAEADAVVVLTEWAEFELLDPSFFNENLKHPVVFDFRNIFSLEEMNNNGIMYFSIGRPCQNYQKLKQLQEDYKKKSLAA
jgi:UDPglucose 6-dehydrogenase